MESEQVTEGFDSSHWVRTGRLIRIDPRWGAREVKFNPNHDPRNGRFTFAEGGSADMSRSPGPRQAGKDNGTWGGGGFTGGGGGLTGGGGVTGYYMTHDEVRAY